MLRARRGGDAPFQRAAFARVPAVAGTERRWSGRERAGSVARTRRNRPEVPSSSKNSPSKAAGPRTSSRPLLGGPRGWLESVLRRDITRLDPGLRLAPLHAQFRASRDARGAARPVDLLALRRDGRLVVAELKVNEDAALALQGADYWRRVTAQQRAGHIRTARLFGDARVSNDPPLVYLVAPLLRFHRSFQTLARCITPDIEIYRFDLNEDWRAGVRVMRRVL